MALCRSKLAIIGMGHVGTVLAHHLVIENMCDELVLINRDRKKAWAEAEDLNHALGFTGTRMQIFEGDYSQCADADIVVLCVSPRFEAGMTRMDMLESAGRIVQEIVPRVMETGFSGIFVVITNPVDAMSYLVHRLSGLPSSKVIGTGTSLDSARLRCFLADTMDLDSRSVMAMCMGEHGDSQMIPWSQVTVGAKKFSQILQDNPDRLAGIDIKRIGHDVSQVAYEIIKAKGATNYGIASVAAGIIRAIVKDENMVMPASVMLNGEYGVRDVYAGVPAVITREGIKELVVYHLTHSEKEEFLSSIDLLRQANSKMLKVLGLGE